MKPNSQERMRWLAGGQGAHCQRQITVEENISCHLYNLPGKAASKLQTKLASLVFFWLFFSVRFTVNLSPLSSSVYSEFIILSFPHVIQADTVCHWGGMTARDQPLLQTARLCYHNMAEVQCLFLETENCDF